MSNAPCMKTEWRANYRGRESVSWWTVDEYHDGDEVRRIVDCGTSEALARRIAALPKLEAIVDQLDKTADGVLITDGMACYFRCANGTLCFHAYLSPQPEPTEAYPWDKSYSTPEAVEAARKEMG